MSHPRTPQPEFVDEFELVFEPDPVALFIAESLEHEGFSHENAWLIATRAAQHELDWHKAVRLWKTGRWTELEIVKVLV